MREGLTVTILSWDPCDDKAEGWDPPRNFELEIRAWTERFSGSARVWASLGELSELADLIGRFPSRLPDEVKFAFYGGALGDCDLRIFTADQSGHVVVEVNIGEHEEPISSSAVFGISVEAAALDRFARELRAIEAAREGTATLGERL